MPMNHRLTQNVQNIWPPILCMGIVLIGNDDISNICRTKPMTEHVIILPLNGSYLKQKARARNGIAIGDRVF